MLMLPVLLLEPHDSLFHLLHSYYVYTKEKHEMLLDSLIVACLSLYADVFEFLFSNNITSFF